MSADEPNLRSNKREHTHHNRLLNYVAVKIYYQIFIEG